MTLEDRPASLRRSTPRPSPVENIDPIDTPSTSAPILAPAAVSPTEAPTKAKTPKRGSAAGNSAPADPAPVAATPTAAPEPAEQPASAAAPAFKRARGPREREIVVQLNSKIALKARDTLDRITAYDGRTIRSGIETGIYLLDYLIEKEKSGEAPVLEEMLAIYGADD